jgi:hypothetical protein
MTRERDIDRILDLWFAERPTEVADRVLDEVADRIGRQSQEPAWLVLWRDSHVNTYLKYSAAVVAVIVVAGLGFAVFGSPTGPSVGGPVSPTPSPSPAVSASPSAAPSTSAVFPSWYPQDGQGAGILPAGSQTTRQFIAGTTFTVPDGWVNDGDFAPAYFLFPDTPANEAEYGVSKQKAQEIVLAAPVQDNMFAICDATGLFPGGTAAEVIDALVANEALSTTQPVDVTIGSLSGRQVDVQLSPNWTRSCMLNSDDPPNYDFKDVRSRVIMLDSPDGRTIGISINSRYSSAFEALLADGMPVVESFQFNLGPEASPS